MWTETRTTGGLPIGNPPAYYRCMTFARLVDETLRRRGWDQKRLAEEAGVSQPTISRILNGERIGRGDTIALITRALELDPVAVQASLSGGVVPASQHSRSPEDILRELEASIANGPIRIPEVHISAGAGEGVIAEAGVDYWPYDPAPEERGHSIVAVPVRGTCMEPEIHPGQRVYVDKDSSPRSGDMVVAIHEGEVIIRRLVGTNGDRRLVANKDHAPLDVTDRTIIFGVVVFAGQRPARRPA